jgi:hypothetical protein
MESGRETEKKKEKRKEGSCVFILSHGDIVAISKMNVTLGTGGSVSWQSVEKWVRKTSIIAMFLLGKRKR